MRNEYSNHLHTTADIVFLVLIRQCGVIILSLVGIWRFNLKMLITYNYRQKRPCKMQPCKQIVCHKINSFIIDSIGNRGNKGTRLLIIITVFRTKTLKMRKNKTILYFLFIFQIYIIIYVGNLRQIANKICPFPRVKIIFFFQN